MNYRVLFFVIALATFIMGTILFMVVAGGAKQAQIQVLREQENTTLYDPIITKGIFGVGEPAFSDLDHDCEVPFLNQAYISLALQYHLEPQICAFFVNDKLARTATDLEADCIRECPYGEFTRTIPLGFHDVRENHIVKVCCEDICIERSMKKLCA